MNLSSFATLLTLVASAVSQVPNLPRKSPGLRDREASTPGCVDATGNDQHVAFYSSSKLFDMRVPMDGHNYNIGKPSAQLQCTDMTSSTQGSCAPCWHKMDHVETTHSDSCSVAFMGDDGKLFFVDTDKTKGLVALLKPGYPAIVTCHKPRMEVVREIENIRDTELNCGGTDGIEIVLDTGSQDYLLLLRADQNVYEVIGPDSSIGCIGPLLQEDVMCQACNFPVQTIELSPEAGTCAFNLSGYANLLYHNSKDAKLTLPVPTQIWSIACGLDDMRQEKREAYHENPEPLPGQHESRVSETATIIVTDQEDAKIIARKSVDLARDTTASWGDLCQDSGYKLSIFTTDGKVYCSPVPLDMKFHPVAEVSCLRPTDRAVVPCNQIGAAIAVHSVDEWGPCIFFTEDHRSFYLPYKNVASDGSYTSDCQPIVPGNAVSGIECGTG